MFRALEVRGWILEGSATNTALWSNSFTAEHGHTLTNCTASVSDSEYVLTDGSGAPRYATIITATADQGRVGKSDISVTAGTKVNWSIFVKAISGKFRFAGYDGSKLISVFFDCATRTFSGLSDPSAISSELQYEDIGNGWFRLSVTITPTVTASNAAATIGLELNGNSGCISGAQFVTAPVVTSYVYTEASAVTRASEGADTSGNGLSIPLSQAMIDSLVGELLDGAVAWTHVSGTAPAYSGGNRILTYAGALTSSDYHALSATLAVGSEVEVSYTISEYAAGSVTLGFGTAAGTARNADGTYTERGILTDSTRLYVNATGFTGALDILSIRRVLESGQTNRGEGTICQWVGIIDSAAWPLSKIFNVCTQFNSVTNPSLLYFYRSSSGPNVDLNCGDGVSYVRMGNSTGLPAGRYCLISQWSAALGKMRVGLLNPTTGSLTWSSPTLAAATTYRGFFPIYGTGDLRRLRFFYGGGAFPIHILGLRWPNAIISDAEAIRLSKEVLA